MHANGCSKKHCNYPEDKGLQLVPVWLHETPTISGGTRVEYDCTWTNYKGPATVRAYYVCADHYLQASEMIENLAEESKQIDQYLARRRK